MVAAIRPSDVEVALFFHVLGAMALMGTLAAVAFALVFAWRGAANGSVRPLTRFGLWTWICGVFPAYVVMRIGAQWTEAAWDYPENFDPAWLGIGYITADLGGLLILISLVLSIIGLRQTRESVDRNVLSRIVAVVSILVIVLFLVAIYAMTVKPT